MHKRTRIQKTYLLSLDTFKKHRHIHLQVFLLATGHICSSILVQKCFPVVQR